MFLKLFEPIFAALNKNTRLTLWAIVLAVLISWGVTGEVRVKNSKEDCDEDRKNDRETIASQAAELKDMRQRLMDFAFGKVETEKKTQENDSVIREQMNKELNKVMP